MADPIGCWRCGECGFRAEDAQRMIAHLRSVHHRPIELPRRVPVEALAASDPAPGAD